MVGRASSLLLSCNLPSNWRPASHGTGNRTHDEQNEKYEKENLCDPRCGTGDSGESEKTGDQSENQKSQSPCQHCDLLIES
jgi:hypothetical protein